MTTYLENLTLRLAAGLGELPAEVREPHVRYLKSAQRSDGGFAGRDGGSDLYYTGFGLRGLAVLANFTATPPSGRPLFSGDDYQDGNRSSISFL